MKRGITFLVLWLVIAVFLAGNFIEAIPPGGVDWPYYLFVPCIPLGTLLYARFPGRGSVAFCYGLLAGLWFALPIFDDGRRLLAGATTVEQVALKVGLFAMAMSLVCSGAFAGGRRLFGSNLIARREENTRSQPSALLDCLIVAAGVGFLVLIWASGIEAGQSVTKGVGAILGGLYSIYLGVLFLLSYLCPDRTYILNILRYACEVCSMPASHYMAWFYFALFLAGGSWLLLIGFGVL
jgi:hypothetical protein